MIGGGRHIITMTTGAQINCTVYIQATPGAVAVEVAAAKPPPKPTVKAMYTYKGKTGREISMRKGDVLTLLSSSNKVSSNIL